MKQKAVWKPETEQMKKMKLYRLMNKLGYSDYDAFYRQSVKDIAWFWHEVVKDMGLKWFRSYDRVLDTSKGIRWPKWFVGGAFNITDAAVDKWAEDDRVAKRRAIIWEGEEGAVRSYTYEALSDWVSRVASGLRRRGIKKGDCIALYMPMIPETLVAMMAAAKIGAVFTPIFSGYAAEAIAKRLKAANVKLLITADGFYRKGKEIAMKEEADRAMDLAPQVEKLVVVRRLQRSIPWNEGRDWEWTELESAAKDAPTEVMQSDDPFMIIYSSGTTGRPKGIVHTHTGFPIKAAFDAGYGMDVQGGDVVFWYTDMGWMMGPFLVFASLLNAATMVFYEGAPDYPNPDRVWKLVESHRVTHLGISPTLIRSLKTRGSQWVENRNLSTLKMIGSTGEPWNDEPWFWLFHEVGKGKIPIVNYSGGTEISGGILTNILLKPIAPVGFNSPVPGMDADVYDEKGKAVRGEVGELVIKQPWVGMAHGFWKEPERYEKTYWSRWPDTWVHGDWVRIDEEGFWYITGRSDDTLNIAGKRMGPAEMESVLVEDDRVVEAATIGVPHEVKGEAAVCFVVLEQGTAPGKELEEELSARVVSQLGKTLRPERIYFVPDLPKTRNAKVMRRAIRSAFLDRDAGDLSALVNPKSLQPIRDFGKPYGNE